MLGEIRARDKSIEFAAKIKWSVKWKTNPMENSIESKLAYRLHQRINEWKKPLVRPLYRGDLPSNRLQSIHAMCVCPIRCHLFCSICATISVYRHIDCKLRQRNTYQMHKIIIIIICVTPTASHNSVECMKANHVRLLWVSFAIFPFTSFFFSVAAMDWCVSLVYNYSDLIRGTLFTHECDHKSTAQ